jgi:hypothetical protein
MASDSILIEIFAIFQNMDAHTKKFFSSLCLVLASRSEKNKYVCGTNKMYGAIKYGKQIVVSLAVGLVVLH